MHLVSSMLLVSNLLRRPILAGSTPQVANPPPNWILVPGGNDQFDILASRVNGDAPILTSPYDTILRIGAAAWQLAALNAGSFRILSSLPTSFVPVASTAGGTLISIGS